MEKKNAWLVLLIGVALILPMIGITQLGSLTSGAISWIIPILILLIGIMGLMDAPKTAKKKK